MPKYWMINDRDKGGVGTSPNKTTEGLTYWVTDKTPLNVIGNWTKVSAASFAAQLKAAADAFPDKPPEKQSHVTILVHGYNVSFDHSTRLRISCRSFTIGCWSNKRTRSRPPKRR